MKISRFKWQVAHLFRGQVLFALAQFLVLALLSRFGGDEQSGAYVLAMVTTAPIFLFLDLDLRTVRSTDQKHPEVFQSYLGLRLWCLLLASIISLSIAFFFFFEYLAMFVVMTVFRIGDSLSNLAFGGFQRMIRSELVGKSLAVKGLIAIVTILLLALMSNGSAVVVGSGMAAIAILFALFRDLPKAFELNQPDASLSGELVVSALTDHAAQIRIARRALPLGIDACMSSLILNFPRYCVHAFLGIAALGVFGLLMQLAYSIQLLVGAVGHTGVAPLADLREKQERDKFWKLLAKMSATSLVVGMLAVVGGTLIIPNLFAYFLGPEYNRPLLVMILLTASCLTGTQRTVARATQACGRYYIYMMFDGIIFVTSLAGSWYFVKQYGLPGGATALLLAFGVGLVSTLIHTYFFLWTGKEQSSHRATKLPSANAKS